MARPGNGCLAMINNQFDQAWHFFIELKWANVSQSSCGKLLETYPERLTAVIWHDHGQLRGKLLDCSRTATPVSSCNQSQTAARWNQSVPLLNHALGFLSLACLWPRQVKGYWRDRAYGGEGGFKKKEHFDFNMDWRTFHCSRKCLLCLFWVLYIRNVANA